MFCTGAGVRPARAGTKYLDGLILVIRYISVSKRVDANTVRRFECRLGTKDRANGCYISLSARSEDENRRGAASGLVAIRHIDQAFRIDHDADRLAQGRF